MKFHLQPVGVGGGWGGGVAPSAFDVGCLTRVTGSWKFSPRVFWNSSETYEPFSLKTGGH